MSKADRILLKHLNEGLREFTQSDWMGLSGAEKLSDGSEPMIDDDDDIKLRGIPAMIVISNTMTEISSFMDDGGEGPSYWYQTDIAGKAAATGLYNKIIAQGKNMKPEYLTNIGFKKRS